MAFHILIAEDEGMIADLLREILEDAGYRVTVTADGMAAAAADADDPADLLLTDIRMPEMDGLELAAELRRRRPRLPVIVLAGDPGTMAAGDIPGAGPTRVLVKPVWGEDLLTLIGGALAQTS